MFSRLRSSLQTKQKQQFEEVCVTHLWQQPFQQIDWLVATQIFFIFTPNLGEMIQID